MFPSVTGVSVLTEGSSEGHAGVSDHFGGGPGGLQVPEREPAPDRAAAETEHPCPGPGAGLCPPPAGSLLTGACY